VTVSNQSKQSRDERNMRGNYSWRRLSSVCATDLPKRERVSIVRNRDDRTKANISDNNNTIISRRKAIAGSTNTCMQNQMRISKLIQVSVVVTIILVTRTITLWMQRYASENMAIVTNYCAWGLPERIDEQSKMPPKLQSCFWSPLMVSASTMPSTAFRFYHNQRKVKNGCRFEAWYNPHSNDTLSSTLQLFGIDRFRGGSRHDFRYQDRRSSQQNSDTKISAHHRNNTNSPLASLIQSRNRVSKAVRQGTGAMFSLAGFLGSSFVSFVTDRRSFEDRFVEPFRALNNFLKASG